LLKVAEAAAVKAVAPALLARVEAREQQTEVLRPAYEKVRTALAKLRDEPKDPAASTVAGQFLCAAKGDWFNGLKRLLHGGDAALAKLAEKDLETPANPAEQAANRLGLVGVGGAAAGAVAVGGAAAGGVLVRPVAAEPDRPDPRSTRRPADADGRGTTAQAGTGRRVLRRQDLQEAAEGPDRLRLRLQVGRPAAAAGAGRRRVRRPLDGLVDRPATRPAPVWCWRRTAWPG